MVLPAKSASREVWLTRSQAARLIWAAWRAKQIMQDKRTERAVGRHLARFILTGLYTGTRSGAICGAALMPTIGRGHVDLEQGVFYRRAAGARETKKRQPPVRLPDRLLAHLRRWHRLGIAKQAVVEWNGKPVRSVRKAFATAVKAAGLDGLGITPHVLRHTAATWAMQGGGDLWQIAGFLGMTVEMLERTMAPSSRLPARGGGSRGPFTGTETGQIPRERNATNGVKRDENRRDYKGRMMKSPRSGRGGRRFKSCHSDQHLAAFQLASPRLCRQLGWTNAEHDAR